MRKRSGIDREASQAYLATCIEAFRSKIGSFLAGRPEELTYTCVIEDSLRIMLQFRMDGSTASKPIAIPAATKADLARFARTLTQGMLLKFSSGAKVKGNAVVNYYYLIEDNASIGPPAE